MSNSTAHEIAIQDRSAGYYNRRYTGYGQRYHRFILNWLCHEAFGHILDAGCGTGFASRCFPEKNIIGIDISPGMLARHSGTHHLMDVCKMSTYWSQTFDFVICRSLLHHLPNYHKGLAEMHRVMKPGAKIAFWETNQSAIATWVRSKTQHGDRFSRYHHSFKDTDLLRNILKMGFEIDQVKYLGYLAYPCFGFPDIIPFERVIPFKPVLYPLCLEVDEWLSTMPWIKRLSWSIGIKAHKLPSGSL